MALILLALDRASLNKLKEHIAEEGCPQVQYDLGKKLLENAIGKWPPTIGNVTLKISSTPKQNQMWPTRVRRLCIGW